MVLVTAERALDIEAYQIRGEHERTFVFPIKVYADAADGLGEISHHIIICLCARRNPLDTASATVDA